MCLPDHEREASKQSCANVTVKKQKRGSIPQSIAAHKRHWGFFYCSLDFCLTLGGSLEKLQQYMLSPAIHSLLLTGKG